MNKYVIKNTSVVNEGVISKKDIYVTGDLIEKIVDSKNAALAGYTIIDATGKHLIPGVIDDQVHFREPGLTHKADIYTESKAAVAGGVTSYMEMPNTKPQTTTIEELEKKQEIAAQKSLANYSFYLGATNDNIDELRKLDTKSTCGVKVFMGSSTGNMLVDNENTLSAIFSEVGIPVAIHSEDEETIKANLEFYKQKYGEDIPISAHPLIRSAEACYKTTERAVRLAKKYNTSLHVLHLSTCKEMELFESAPVKNKRITAEVCVHHLWFDDRDYEKYGNLIRWNPAVKTLDDKNALMKALLEDKIDVVATDHAPHTIEEKSSNYLNSFSGGPLVQHSLQTMIELYKQNKISIEKVVEKMCHAPAELFDIKNRGFIREGYKADLVLINLDAKQTVSKDNILYKCAWSPFESYTFNSVVETTIVNGNIVYDKGVFCETVKGEMIKFER